jgi:hypothetical protein
MVPPGTFLSKAPASISGWPVQRHDDRSDPNMFLIPNPRLAARFDHQRFETAAIFLIRRDGVNRNTLSKV